MLQYARSGHHQVALIVVRCEFHTLLFAYRYSCGKLLWRRHLILLFPLDAGMADAPFLGMANSEQRRSPVSESVGDYLKAVWIIGGSEPVSTQDLAEHLGISAPSVSGMLVRLHDLGLVHHERYYGAALTDEGKVEALRLVRRHRLIETFLVSHMNYSWEEVHAEAEILEHAVSDRFVEHLSDLLGHPLHDPHGDPIPSPEGSVPMTPDVQITEAGDGRSFRVSRLVTQDPEQLSELACLGLRPGAVVALQERDRKSGSIQIVVDCHEYTLPGELAILVEGEVVD